LLKLGLELSKDKK